LTATPRAFTRPGLVAENSVSMDGVRQDFVVLTRAALSTRGAQKQIPISNIFGSVAALAGRIKKHP
jgi:hypothetical protein